MPSGDEDVDTDQIVEEATKMLGGLSHSIPRRIMEASPRALAHSVVVVLVPILAGHLIGINLIAPVVALALAYVISDISVSDFRYRARARWARYIVAKSAYETTIKGEYEEILKDVEIGLSREAAFELCSAAISDALRTDVSHAREGDVSVDNDQIRFSMEYSTHEIKRALRTLCSATHAVVSSFSEGEVRCGIVVRDAENDVYRPIVVYDPKISNYCSQHIFSNEHFSAKALSEFDSHKKSPRYKDYVAFTNRGNTRALPLIHIDEDQIGYLKDIIGNVLYFRVNAIEIESLGVLSIDCDQEDGLPLERFSEIQKFLLPIYRLMSSYLYMIRSDSRLYSKLQELDETQETG